MSSSFYRRVRNFFFYDLAPVTKVVLGLQLMMLLLLTLSRGGFGLVLDPYRLLIRPWTLITYFLVNGGLHAGDLLSFFFAGLWWWFIGAAMERTWGSLRFALGWLIIVAATGFGITMGVWFSPSIVLVSGWFLPMAGLTVAWAVTHPGQEVMLYGMFPLRSKWLAWLSVAFLSLRYLSIHPVLGIFSLLGPGVGYALGYMWPGNWTRRIKWFGFLNRRSRNGNRLRRVK